MSASTSFVLVTNQSNTVAHVSSLGSIGRIIKSRNGICVCARTRSVNILYRSCNRTIRWNIFEQLLLVELDDRETEDSYLMKETDDLLRLGIG